MVVFAAFTALGGLVALLAGAYGLRQTRRVSEAGLVAQALVKAVRQGEERPTLQFETADGRVVEIVSPVPPSRRRPLAAGARLRVAYDPEDPREVVVLGGERRGVDWGFVIAGAGLVVAGLALGLAAG
ncbi:hypothetical protein [Streptomyces sp. G45]|uniref:hypothetical protein n=1 Tax=Streptomyces sp. G45 TaxID=3406627 RepID=UPI003C297C2A